MSILRLITSPDRRATGHGLRNIIGLVGGRRWDWIFGALPDPEVSLQAIFAVLAGVALVSVGFVLGIRSPQLAPKDSL